MLQRRNLGTYSIKAVNAKRPAYNWLLLRFPSQIRAAVSFKSDTSYRFHSASFQKSFGRKKEWLSIRMRHHVSTLPRFLNEFIAAPITNPPVYSSSLHPDEFNSPADGHCCLMPPPPLASNCVHLFQRYYRKLNLGGDAMHWGSVCASHPLAPGSNTRSTRRV